MPLEIILAAILGLAAFTFSFAGFGFPLVTIPLLSFCMPTREAVAFQFPFTLGMVIYHFWRFGGQISWQRHWPMLAGASLGMPMGLLLLLRLPEAWLQRGLALVIAAAVLSLRLDAGRRLAKRVTGSVAFGLCAGLLSGWLQGSYSAGGPPAAIYIVASGKRPQEIKGFLGAYFTFIMLVSGGLFLWGGVLSLGGMAGVMWYAPVVVAGAAAGAWAFRRAGAVAFRWAIDLLLLLAAALLWWRA